MVTETEHQPHCQTVTQVQFIQALLLVLFYINTHNGSTQKNCPPKSDQRPGPLASQLIKKEIQFN